jgi:type II secretory ATPase GspE/PulE/Tfp pilus assembly ATPase PilB-like protein
MPFKSHLIRQLAYQCSNPDLIQAQAQAEGMVTISDGALKLVAEGLTSLSEALTLYAPD